MADDDKSNDSLIRKAFDWAMSVDRDEELFFVNELARKYPTRNRRELADKIIGRARWWGVGSGVVTGLPANPWVAAPAAIGDVGAMLRAEVVMAARIALLFDPRYLDDGEPPYELLVPIMGSRAASEFMRELAIRGGMGTSRQAIKKILTKETLKQFKRIMLKYFGLKVTQRGIITKTLPIVGGVIGGTWNYAEVKIVGDRVYSYFEGKALGDEGSPTA
ncbi:hypothetical protein [Polyangium sp. 15x6]|uniref:hypothetical protein n=1 Tax=Polyangium sp. 15x6 TaxID=3042687 RepID=UPI00249B30FE|nr:hypothetical protein [Polyangium sp. 15x6]MDI3290682.1 hypothetical protein [Polyangium sp. 15x6]